jgi:hypothetical protein
MVPLESGRTRFSSRFSRLIVSLITGEDAFPCSQGDGNWHYASPNIEIQVIKGSLCRSSPDKYRSRPNVSHTIVTTVVIDSCVDSSGSVGQELTLARFWGSCAFVVPSNREKAARIGLGRQCISPRCVRNDFLGETLFNAAPHWFLGRLTQWMSTR